MGSTPRFSVCDGQKKQALRFRCLILVPRTPRHRVQVCKAYDLGMQTVSARLIERL